MTLAIFTLVEHTFHNNKYYGYAPYIHQINLWIAHAEEVIVVAPKSASQTLDNIQEAYNHPNVRLVEVPTFHVKGIGGLLKTLVLLPGMFIKMSKVMRKADHLHFRCPSNVSAIALLVQMWFPSKRKTAKYAGNWDPKSKQPIGYRFQKWMLSNTKLTRNMKALVFGEWPNQSRNIIAFNSASFSENEKVAFVKRDYQKPFRFVCIGSLVEGKQPLLSLKIVEGLNKKGIEAHIDFYGEGVLRTDLEQYIVENQLEAVAKLHGNQTRATIIDALKQSDFSILPSKSEGWPKAISEAMFFRCIPIATKVSCLEWMLDYGKRGILIDNDLESAIDTISKTISSEAMLHELSLAAFEWSQQFTIERIQKDIAQVLDK